MERERRMGEDGGEKRSATPPDAGPALGYMQKPAVFGPFLVALQRLSVETMASDLDSRVVNEKRASMIAARFTAWSRGHGHGVTQKCKTIVQVQV